MKTWLFCGVALSAMSVVDCNARAEDPKASLTATNSERDRERLRTSLGAMTHGERSTYRSLLEQSIERTKRLPESDPERARQLKQYESDLTTLNEFVEAKFKRPSSMSLQERAERMRLVRPQFGSQHLGVANGESVSEEERLRRENLRTSIAKMSFNERSAYRRLLNQSAAGVEGFDAKTQAAQRRRYEVDSQILSEVENPQTRSRLSDTDSFPDPMIAGKLILALDGQEYSTLSDGDRRVKAEQRANHFCRFLGFERAINFTLGANSGSDQLLKFVGEGYDTQTDQGHLKSHSYTSTRSEVVQTGTDVYRNFWGYGWEVARVPVYQRVDYDVHFNIPERVYGEHFTQIDCKGEPLKNVPAEILVDESTIRKAEDRLGAVAVPNGDPKESGAKGSQDVVPASHGPKW